MWLSKGVYTVCVKEGLGKPSVIINILLQVDVPPLEPLLCAA